MENENESLRTDLNLIGNQTKILEEKSFELNKANKSERRKKKKKKNFY